MNSQQIFAMPHISINQWLPYVKTTRGRNLHEEGGEEEEYSEREGNESPSVHKDKLILRAWEKSILFSVLLSSFRRELLINGRSITRARKRRLFKRKEKPTNSQLYITKYKITVMSFVCVCVWVCDFQRRTRLSLRMLISKLLPVEFVGCS